jgi:hypothetical protein
VRRLPFQNASTLFIILLCKIVIICVEFLTLTSELPLIPALEKVEKRTGELDVNTEVPVLSEILRVIVLGVIGTVVPPPRTFLKGGLFGV